MALKVNKWLIIIGLLTTSLLVSYFLIDGADQKIGIAADCAFMLPVATPPNALAYSSNEFTINKMMKTGFLLNLIAIILIWLITSFRFLNPF